MKRLPAAGFEAPSDTRSQEIRPTHDGANSAPGRHLRKPNAGQSAISPRTIRRVAGSAQCNSLSHNHLTPPVHQRTIRAPQGADAQFHCVGHENRRTLAATCFPRLRSCLPMQHATRKNKSTCDLSAGRNSDRRNDFLRPATPKKNQRMSVLLHCCSAAGDWAATHFPSYYP